MSKRDQVREAALASVHLAADVRKRWCAEPPAPAPMQVWRARWDTTAGLVALLDVKDSRVQIAMITLEPTAAPPEAQHVPSEATDLGAELSVWSHLPRDVPVRVLDRHLSLLDRAAFRSPRPATWPAVVPVSRSRQVAEKTAWVYDTLDALAAATWVPPVAEDLATLIRECKAIPHLAELPGAQPMDVLAIGRGVRQPTEEQAEFLAARTGVAATRWLAAGRELPSDLVRTLDEPRVRSRLAALATDQERNEGETRLRIARSVLTLAARQTGTGKTEDWRHRLELYLEQRGV